jgi:hypothetical protein
VLHYIVDHGYLPPPGFLAQVAALPHALPAGWSVRRLTTVRRLTAVERERIETLANVRNRATKKSASRKKATKKSASRKKASKKRG